MGSIRLKAPPLGPREDVIRALQDWIPGISFDAQGKGEVSAADHRLALDIGPLTQVHAAVASAEGDTAIECCAQRARAGRLARVCTEGRGVHRARCADLFALPDDAPPQGRL